jgi:uncharacterized protein (TIGR02453 family)
MADPRFSQKTLDFIQKASRQKKSEWLDRNRSEYESVLVEPARHTIRKVASLLKQSSPNEIVRYQFPDRAIARIRRSAARAEAQGWYKDWIGIQVSRDSGSLYEELPGLYFHIAPGTENVFSAGGLYLPSSTQLRRIRAWVAQDASPLEALLEDSEFRKVYSALGTERQVKTFPRGYPKDHPKMPWLRLTAFYVWRPFSKKVFFSSSFAEVLASDWRQVLRLNPVLDQWISREVSDERILQKEKPSISKAQKVPSVRRPEEWDW